MFIRIDTAHDPAFFCICCHARILSNISPAGSSFGTCGTNSPRKGFAKAEGVSFSTRAAASWCRLAGPTKGLSREFEIAYLVRL